MVKPTRRSAGPVATRRSAGDPSRLNRVAARRSSLRFGRNTPGIPPSRAHRWVPPPFRLAQIHPVFLPHAPCQPGASPASALTRVPPPAVNSRWWNPRGPVAVKMQSRRGAESPDGALARERRCSHRHRPAQRGETPYLPLPGWRTSRHIPHPAERRAGQGPPTSGQFSRWGPAPRGSAKPTLMTLRHTNVSAALAPNPGPAPPAAAAPYP